MAKLVYAFGSSHGPQLSLPAPQWELRSKLDRKRTEAQYRGGVYTYDELLKLRANPHFDAMNAVEARETHYQRCQAALDKLADKLAEVKPDAVILLGDDQHEWFHSSVQPAIAVLCGETVTNRKYDRAEFGPNPTGIETAATGWRPPTDQHYPVDTALAKAIIAQMVEDEFDVTICAQSPADENGPLCITHSVGFIVRRIMRDKPIPLAPILQNTFYPPNQIKPGRSYDFGKALARAIANWNSDARVAICASGGLSHYVLDEEWDRKMLAAMMTGDVQTLRDEPNSMFQSGTSETKNWIALCGAVAETPLKMNLIDYVPCYRTEAGTGNGMAFATWA